MVKRLLKKFFSKQTISIVVATIFLVLSLFGATRIDINENTDILTLLLAFVFLLIFGSSLIFMSFMLAIDSEEKKKQEDKIE